MKTTYKNEATHTHTHTHGLNHGVEYQTLASTMNATEKTETRKLSRQRISACWFCKNDSP